MGFSCVTVQLRRSPHYTNPSSKKVTYGISFECSTSKPAFPAHRGSTGLTEHFLRTTPPPPNMAAANFVRITNVSLMNAGMSN